MLANMHYTVALAVLMLYGIKVCPFLESLTPWQLGTPIAVGLIAQGLLRSYLMRRASGSSASPPSPKWVLISELSLFACTGFGVALYNTLYYGFPIESGIKVLIGFTSVGFFIAIDLALERERNQAEHRDAQQVLNDGKRIFPVSKKLALFATVTALSVALILFLVVNKDLLWLMEVNERVAIEEARVSIIKEFLFVSLVVLGYVLNIIHSYAKNLNLFFSTQNRVLEQTNKGDLSGHVPVSTNDEFGIMAHYTNRMVAAIRDRTAEVQRTQDVTILSLASLAETRDNETGTHILRTQRYVRTLATHLATASPYADRLDESTIDLLYKSAPLHDIGKVGIPDSILLKPGKLTPEEFTIMQTHTTLGRDAILVAEREQGGSSFLSLAREIAESHHEKWDGSGYPAQLKGEQIPLSGRLMALADVYDALVSKRVYKPAFSHERARSIILDGHGSHFDPVVVDAFLATEQAFIQIAANYRDQADSSRDEASPAKQCTGSTDQTIPVAT